MVQVAVVDTAPRGVRTYGNWRRPTSAGLLGLGSMGTNMLLVGLVLVVLVVMTAGLKEALILAGLLLVAVAVVLTKDRHAQRARRRDL